MFLVTSQGKRPVSALQRGFPWAILVMLVATGVSTVLEALSYRHWFHINPLALEIILSSVCLCFVVFAYVGTCMVLTRRTWGTLTLGDDSSYIINTRNMAILKLLAILAAFILVWVWVVSNNVKYLINDEKTAIGKVRPFHVDLLFCFFIRTMKLS